MEVTLEEALTEAEPKLQDISCRLQPTSFSDVGNKIHAFPHPFDWKWTSLENLLRDSESRLVMTSLPVFWQTTTLVNAVCRELEIPIIVNKINDRSVGAASVGLGVDAIVTTAKEAPSFIEYLKEHGRPLSALWFLIHELGADEFKTPPALAESAVLTANEVHLFPGVPVLVQCPAIVSSRKNLFHLSDDFIFDEERVGVVIGKGNGMIAKFSHQLPFTLNDLHTCSCGKRLYGISV